MKNALMIALALGSISAFAGTKVPNNAHKEASAACKAEGKTKKDFKNCVKEKLAAPAVQVAK